MQKTLLYTLLLLFPLLVQAQTWVGGATGDWNDASNWNTAMVPAAGANVIINMDATIGGMVPNPPAQIQIAGVDVTLDFTGTNDLGDAILINNSSSLTIASDVTFSGTTTTPAIQVEPSGALTVQNTGSLTVSSGSNGILVRGGGAVTNAGDITVDNADSYGIDLNGGTGTFTNTGTISIATNSGTDGIQNSGNVVNNGTITITGAASRGIYNLTGSFENNESITITDVDIGILDGTGAFTNTSTGQITINTTSGDGIRTDDTFTNDGGNITVNEAGGDGINVLGGTLTNNGSLNVTSPSIASGGKAGIEIATGATLDNDNNGTVMVEGLGTSAQLIRVGGSLTNSNEITLMGGSVSNRMRVSGDVTNETGGELKMNAGEINVVSGGELTNNGLLTSTLASGINNSGTATNNGFYSYSGIAAFATAGTVNDLGIDLKDTGDTEIDAGGSCTVNIANAAYEYFEGSTSVGTSDGSGQIELSNLSSTTMVTLTNSLTGVQITIENVCAAALPITLTSFTAKPNGKDVLIEWETATELNNDYMAVERSGDSRRFEEIGRVAGAGNSNTPIQYMLVDETPLPGKNYYRLRQVDFDGTVSYSNVRSVNLQSSNGGAIGVYPTVCSGKEPLTITLPDVGRQGQVVLDIFHSSGARVHSVTMPLGRQQQLLLPELNTGTYLIRSRDERTTLSGRFIIVR